MENIQGCLVNINIFTYIPLKVYFAQLPGYFMTQLIEAIFLGLQLICFILLVMGGESYRLQVTLMCSLWLTVLAY